MLALTTIFQDNFGFILSYGGPEWKFQIKRGICSVFKLIFTLINQFLLWSNFVLLTTCLHRLSIILHPYSSSFCIGYLEPRFWMFPDVSIFWSVSIDLVVCKVLTNYAVCFQSGFLQIYFITVMCMILTFQTPDHVFQIIHASTEERAWKRSTHSNAGARRESRDRTVNDVRITGDSKLECFV